MIKLCCVMGLIVLLLMGCSMYGKFQNYEITGEIVAKRDQDVIIKLENEQYWKCRDLSLYYETDIGDVVVLCLYASKDYQGSGAGTLQTWRHK